MSWVDAVAADARFQGIPWVVVTMGAAGAVAFHEGHRYRVTTPAIEAVNATGFRRLHGGGLRACHRPGCR